MRVIESPEHRADNPSNILEGIMKSKIKYPLIALFLFFFISAEPKENQKPEWKGTIAKEGEVTVVKNPKEPMYKEPILSIREDWVIGGAEAEGEYAIAKPYGMAVDQGGNLYVLDLQDDAVKVYDNNAKFVRRIGRRGQGPGEIGGALSISLPKGANALAVLDIGNRRLTFFALDGRFLRSLPLRRFWNDVQVDSTGNIYASETVFKPGERIDVLRKMNPDMSQVLVGIFDLPADESPNPFKPRDRWILDDKDRLVYGDAKTYEIRYFDPKCKLVRRILRNWDPLKVTQKDIAEFRNRRVPPGLSLPKDFPSHHSAYRRFFADDQGRLFVQTWERTHDNRMDIYDIFDAEGRFISRVPLARHSDLINPKIRIMRNGKLYTIEPDEEGYEVVKRYQVTWKF